MYQNTAELTRLQFSSRVGRHTQNGGNSFGFTIAGCSMVDSEQTTVHVFPTLPWPGERTLRPGEEQLSDRR